jgi:hypothetical protein
MANIDKDDFPIGTRVRVLSCSMPGATSLVSKCTLEDMDSPEGTVIPVPDVSILRKAFEAGDYTGPGNPDNIVVCVQNSDGQYIGVAKSGSIEKVQDKPERGPQGVFVYLEGEVFELLDELRGIRVGMTTLDLQRWFNKRKKT